MDLQLYLRVLWRFRVVVGAGLLLAIGLASLSYVRVDLSGGPSFEYRQAEQWESLATIRVGSRTFTPGSAIPPEVRSALQAPPASEEEARQRLSEADASKFSSLAALNEATVQLLQLATSDHVLNIMRKDGKGPIDGLLQTFPVESGGSLVPYLTFSAISPSPGGAHELAMRHIEAFMTFVARQQDASGIEADERIVLDVTREPQGAVLLEGRKKTRPIIVFLAVMTVALGLAFILENLRPLVRPVAPSDQDRSALPESRRRSA